MSRKSVSIRGDHSTVYVSIAMMLAIYAGFMITHQDRTEMFPDAFDAWSAWDDLAYAWLPERAFAQSTPPTLKLTPADSISDSDGSGLEGARVLATFESDGRTYAAVASSIPSNRGVQILDLTDPSSITTVGDITYEDSPYLNHAWGDISIFGSDGRTYAAVATYYSGHIQVLDLTDPSSITLAGSTASLPEGVDIVYADSIATFKSNGRTYAAVASDLCIQVLDLTDPYGITPAGSIVCYDDSSHIGASSIATFESDGRTYAAVASSVDDTFQVLDLTDPYGISVVGSITDNDDLYLNGVWGIDTFESDGRTYAAVASPDDNGVQILDLTDPYNIVPAGGIADDDGLYLEGAAQFDTFESDGRIYGVVVSYHSGGVQILDLTDPYNIVPAGGIADDDSIYLDYAWDISTFESDGRTYGAVTSSHYYNVVQILDLTDPYSITPADSITADTDIVYLYGASDIATFESDGRTYGAVASPDDNGVQILDLTDPHNVTAADGITDDDGLRLRSPDHITTFESDGRTYGIVASPDDNGVQILDLTDPHSISPAGHIADTGSIHLDGVLDIDTFESDGRTYATIISDHDNGIQILDLTDHSIITAAGSITDDSLYLDGVLDIDTFESDGRTYGAVVSGYAGGVQILDLTDPYDVAPAGSSPHLSRANSIATFESDGRTYGAVTLYKSIQILDLTDPYDIYPAGNRMPHDNPTDIATFESDSRTYGAVVSYHSGGVQILDLTDPYNVVPAGGITEDSSLYLRSTIGIATFESDGRAYGAVASLFDGIQILDLTDPDSISLTDGIPHADVLKRGGASHISAFESDGRTYGIVASHSSDGVRILDLTDPYDITVAGGIADDDTLHLRGANSMATFESDGRTYAAITSPDEDGIQILDLTDPYDVTAADGITDDDGIHLRGANSMATFESNGRAYGVAASPLDGIQILDLTDPYDITPAGGIADTNMHLADTNHIATFESDGRAYAAVMSPFIHYSHYIQILDLTDPYDVLMAGHTAGNGPPRDISTFELDGRAYAAIAVGNSDIQILNLTDPHNIYPTGSITGSTGFSFYSITSITTFELDGSTYLAVTSPYRGVQTLQIAAKEPDACIGYVADDATPLIPPEIAATGNRFAVDFYRQISVDGNNVFFSPISVHVAFSMVGEAARGETASQLLDVFGFEPDEGLRHNATAMLMSSLNQPDPCATLQMASSLWLAEWFEPYDSYVGVVGDAYQADIETVDFQGGGVNRINDWAAEKTQGKIPKVLDPDAVPENMTSAILNAIYFKGAWEEPFPVGSTRESDFWTGTREVKADFMSMTTEFGYTESDGVQVLGMPYQGDRLSMVVMLPSDRDGLDHLERIVTPELIKGWQESLRPTLVSALVPKFEMSTHYNLILPLVSMGVEDVFDPRTSDLSGMAHLEPDETLYVSIATQDAYVRVNEEGTEAAAVTTVWGGMMTTSIPPKPVPFVADHPFLFLIQDDESGAILFMGRVSDPS